MTDHHPHRGSPEAHMRAVLARIPSTSKRLDMLQRLLSEAYREAQAEAHRRPTERQSA